MLTVAIISKNGSLNERFIESLDFADEILVVVDNSGFKDFIKGKIKFIHHQLAGDFSGQRNFALKNAKNDWVLFVDDDEIVSKQLASEITSTVKDTKYSGFYLKRLDTVYHEVVLHGETGNTKILRLAKKSSGQFVRSVHETWQIKGQVGELQNPLFHTKDHFVSEFLDRISLYGPIDAQNLDQEHKPFSFFRLLFFPKAKFIQNYYLKLGLLDGTVGLFQAYLMSVQSLSVRIFQWISKKSSIA